MSELAVKLRVEEFAALGNLSPQHSPAAPFQMSFFNVSIPETIDSSDVS